MGRWSRVHAGSLQPGAWTFRDVTEESLRDFIRTSSAGRPPHGGWLGRSRSACGRGGHCLQWVLLTVSCVGREAGRTCAAVVGAQMAASDPS